MDLLTWVPTGIGIVLFLGAAAVYLRGSRDKGTIETLSRNNTALTERVSILEGSDRSNKERIAAQQDKLTAQEQTIEVLTNTVTSADLIQSLASQLISHHEAAMEGLDQIHGDLEGLPVRLAELMVEEAP